MRLSFVGIILVASTSFCHSAFSQELSLGPSFPCSRASSPNEITICQDPRLSELDRLRAIDFAKERKQDLAKAIREAKSLLSQREQCVNDSLCILDTLTYAYSASVNPSWLEGYRKVLIQKVANMNLSSKADAAVGRTGSYVLSNKGTAATVSAINGTDSSEATVVAIVTPADSREYCERDPGGETIANGGRQTIEQCIKAEQISRHGIPIKTTANCIEKTIEGDDGNLKVVGFDMGVIWKDKDGEIRQFGADTGPADSNFQLLCPNTYARLRAMLN